MLILEFWSLTLGLWMLILEQCAHHGVEDVYPELLTWSWRDHPYAIEAHNGVLETHPRVMEAYSVVPWANFDAMGAVRASPYVITFSRS
jgi:hypothetical protein